MTDGQHNKTLAWFTASGLAIALIAGIVGLMVPPGETIWHMVAAPEVDGNWRFATIDGRDVRDAGYGIGIRWGEISGWNDGCNECGFSDDGGMICTLQLCSPRPEDRLFARFRASRPRYRIEGDRLVLTIPGLRAELVRINAD